MQWLGDAMARQEPRPPRKQEDQVSIPPLLLIAFHLAEQFEKRAACGQNQLAVVADGFLIGFNGSYKRIKFAGLLNGFGVTLDHVRICFALLFTRLLFAFAFDSGYLRFGLVENGCFEPETGSRTAFPGVVKDIFSVPGPVRPLLGRQRL